MTHTFPGSKVLSAQVSIDAHALRACIEDRRPDILAALADLTPGEQEQMAVDGWTIGLRALMTAHAHAEQAKFTDIGKSLLEDVERRLADYVAQQERAIGQALARYFDPKDGQLADRLRALLDDQGALAARLHQFVGPERSVLAETLARQVGENSPLLRKLSPTENEGVVSVLQSKVREALEQHRAEVARALDPLHEGGAIARFLGELRKELENADEDRGAQMQRVLASLDANDEASLLSRLMRETQSAHDSLRRALNPMIPDSPLATVKRTLEEMLQERLNQQFERFEQLRLSNDELQKELREAVVRIETRRDETNRSPHGGTDFEHDALAFVEGIVPVGICTFEPTGNTVGLRPRCKVGDAVIRFTEESAFAGSAVVIEAKRDGSYTVPTALQELDEACANRGAGIGLFIMARSHAGDAFRPFARYGSKLLVTWDPEDPSSDGLLHGAIVAAMALAQRKQTKIDQGDINALTDVEQRLVKELDRFAAMDRCAGNILRDAAKISDELRKSGKVLERVIADAQSTLKALKVELRDEAAEVASPIEVSAPPGFAGDAECEADAAEE